jgi:DNA-binding transcriptional LysR family regulator
MGESNAKANGACARLSGNDRESEPGEPLSHRCTRGVRLTHVGEQLAPKSAAAIARVDEIFAHGAARAPRELAGIVRRSSLSVPPNSWLDTVYVYRPYRTPVPARVRLIFDAWCQLLENCDGALSGLSTAASQGHRLPAR